MQLGFLQPNVEYKNHTMKRFHILLIMSLFSGSLALQAQDMDQVKAWVQKLSSQEMYGRGYVFDGAKKAANYVASEFRRMEVDKVFEQTFTSPVNRFPGAMSLTIDGKALRPGIDFLPDGCSSALKGTYDTYTIKPEDLTDRSNLPDIIAAARNKFLVVDVSDEAQVPVETQSLMQSLLAYLQNEHNRGVVGALVLTNKKLTHSVGDDLCWMPVLVVDKEAVGENVGRVQVEIKASLERKYEHRNVVAFIKGTETPEETVVFTAHYDHLGGFGEGTYFPGANDNASGTAMLLALAQHYAQNPPPYSVVLIAFAGEEMGLLGSRHYTQNPLYPLDKIKWLINLDILGTGDEGIKVVNGTIYPDEFDQLVKLNEENGWLPQISPRGEACNSDHCFFHQRNVPCFYFYTLGGIQAYHDPLDKSETLPLTGFSGVFQLITSFVTTL